METPNQMNRRHWLKTSALLTGSFTLGSGLIRSVAAAPAAESLANTHAYTSKRFAEQTIAQQMPQLKARLFANENPFGPSKKARKAIVEALNGSHQYPFMIIRELAGKIAASEGVKPEQVVIGPGSSSLLLGSALLYSKNNGNIVTGDPTYDDLPEKAEMFNAKWIKVPLNTEHKLDLPAMEKAITPETSLVYICNPNNPTGTALDSTQLREFCIRVSKKVPVFIDEAYIDYMEKPEQATMIGLAQEGHNVIVARTFSKLYGFAGLRIGYVIAQPDIVKQLTMYANPIAGISTTTAHAALAAYKDTEFLQEALKKTLESKQYLYDVLSKEGYAFVPSVTNFVIFPIKMPAERFVEEMMKRGVGVRPWQFAGQEWCRVSIGKMDEMKAFAEAFKQIS